MGFSGLDRARKFSLAKLCGIAKFATSLPLRFMQDFADNIRAAKHCSSCEQQINGKPLACI